MFKQLLLISVMLAANSTMAAQVIYPANGQTPEQQQKDEGECHSWAVQNGGYDPSNPPVAQTATQPSGPTGSRLRGAAAGAVVGGVADGDKSDAAVVGAVMGGSRERRQKRKAQNQAQSTASSAQQSGQAAYDNARAACLEGKGYSVK